MTLGNPTLPEYKPRARHFPDFLVRLADSNPRLVSQLNWPFAIYAIWVAGLTLTLLQTLSGSSDCSRRKSPAVVLPNYGQTRGLLSDGSQITLERSALARGRGAIIWLHGS